MPLAITDTRPLDADMPAYDALCAEAGAAAGATNAANAGLVTVVRQCIEGRWWEFQHHSSPAHWCRTILGVASPLAHKLVRVATELCDYPEVAAAFSEGRITLDQVEVVVTTAHPMYDRDLAEVAGRWDIHRMKRIIANFAHPKPQPEPPAPDDEDEPEKTKPAPADLPPDDIRGGFAADGRHRGSWDVDTELGALFDKAMARARSSLYRDKNGIDPEDDDDRTQESSIFTTGEVFRRMLHAALDGLDPNIARRARPGDRTQVVIHMNAEHPEGAHIHLGPLLTTSVRQQLTCDADLRLVLKDIKGIPIETWKRHRVVNSVLRLLIEDRDGGCRIPGCDRTAYLHIHHLWHWEDGGPTIPSNLLALCPEHHKQVHARLLILLGDPTTPDGITVLDRWRRPLPQPGPLPPSRVPASAKPFPATLWGGRLRLN